MKFQKTLITFKTELAWLKVENEEKLQKEILDTKSKFQTICDDLIASMDNRQKAEENRTLRCELLKGQIDELKKEMSAEQAQKEQMRQYISKDDEAKNEVNRTLQKLNKKLETVLKNIQQLEDDMSESSES